MANLLYIEQFDDALTNTPRKASDATQEKLSVQTDPYEKPSVRSDPQEKPSVRSDPLYDAFFGGSGNQYVAKKVSVMTNRPLSIKDKYLMRMDMRAGNLRLYRNLN